MDDEFDEITTALGYIAETNEARDADYTVLKNCYDGTVFVGKLR